MKNARSGWFALAACLALAVSIQAGTVAPPGGRDSLFDVQSISCWSIGVDYQSEGRDVLYDGELEGMNDHFETEELVAYLGLRLTPWLTVFGTVGMVDLEMGDVDASHDGRWSAGLQASLWQYDLQDPEFLAGRYTVRGIVEYGEAETEDDYASGDWSELNVALLLNWEIFVDTIDSLDRYPYSLSLYAGPMFSLIDGDIMSMGVDVDYEEDSEWGIVVGASLNISHNFAVDFGVQHFDDTGYRGGLRYHF